MDSLAQLAKAQGSYMIDIEIVNFEPCNSIQ